MYTYQSTNLWSVCIFPLHHLRTVVSLNMSPEFNIWCLSIKSFIHFLLILQVIFNEIDITYAKNKEYFYKYRFDIPVFHLNGKYLMKHCIDKELLDTALSREEWQNNMYQVMIYGIFSSYYVNVANIFYIVTSFVNKTIFK